MVISGSSVGQMVVREVGWSDGGSGGWGVRLVGVDTSGQVSGGGHFGSDITLLDRHSGVNASLCIITSRIAAL